MLQRGRRIGDLGLRASAPGSPGGVGGRERTPDPGGAGERILAARPFLGALLALAFSAAALLPVPARANPMPDPGPASALLDSLPRAALAGLSRAELPGFSSVAVNDDATALFANPAAIDRSVPAGWYLGWEDDVSGRADRATIGLTGGPGGIGYQRLRLKGAEDVSRWTFALGGGGRGPLSAGVRGAWERQKRVGPDESAWRWDAGLLFRPHDAVSVGLLAEDLNQGRIFGEVYDRTYTAGVAIRPLPFDRRSRLTVFGDYSAREDGDWGDEAILSLGATLEPINGIEIGGSVSGPLGDFGDAPVYRFALGLHALKSTSWYGLRYDERPGGESARHVRNVFATHGTSARQRTLQREPVTARLRLAGIYGDEGQSGVPIPIPMIGSAGSKSIRPTLTELDRAATDPDVKGVLLEIGPLGAGALTSEVRDAIGRVRARGKPVVAYLEDCEGVGPYHVASACDRIVLDPLGTVSRLGMRADILYYGELLDSAGVTFEKLAHGKYKTAGEQLVRRDASEGQKEALNAVLDDWRAVYLADFAAGRELPREKVEELADGRVLMAEQAQAEGLVDTLGDKEDARKLLNRLARQKEKRRPVSLNGWTYREYAWTDGPKVAVLWLDGSIVTGKSGGGFFSENTMGSETVVAQLRKLKKRGDVKAVVLRVDSGGGSAQASDQIWRAVEEVQKEGKKVVASMSRVAGSGGYYIACGADEIFADPMTITGSIGVLGLKPHLARFYDKHRIGVETFERGRLMGMHSSAVPLTEEEKANLQGVIDGVYEKFLARVADGRPLTRDEIDAVGQGRIWTGRQALDRKLIDHVGGLHEALARARELAGLPEDARVEHIRRPRWGLLSRLFDGTGASALAAGRLFGLARPEAGGETGGGVAWGASDPGGTAAATDPRTLAALVPALGSLSLGTDPLQAWWLREVWRERLAPGSTGPALCRNPVIDALLATP